MGNSNSRFLGILSLCLLFVVTVPILYTYYKTDGSSNLVDDKFEGQFITGRGIKIGSSNPKVIVEEYFAITCGACKKFYPTLKKLKKSYAESDVSFVHYDFPIDDVSLQSVVVGRSLNDDNLFLKFVDHLMSNAQEWSNASNYQLAFEKIAAKISKKDLKEFATKRDEYLKFSEYILSLRESMINDAGVKSVPTIIINGKVYEGERTFEKLSKAIDSALKSS